MHADNAREPKHSVPANVEVRITERTNPVRNDSWLIDRIKPYTVLLGKLAQLFIEMIPITFG